MPVVSFEFSRRRGARPTGHQGGGRRARHTTTERIATGAEYRNHAPGIRDRSDTAPAAPPYSLAIFMRAIWSCAFSFLAPSICEPQPGLVRLG